MTQFSSFFGGHFEEMRDQFVAHKDKKELEIVYVATSRFRVDFASFASQINDLIEQNLVDPELRAWIVPRFSASTQNDVVISSIVMMGTLQHYFRYSALMICGIPSVRLLGEKSDYEDIFGRLDKLEQYGEEPSQFAQLLRPILKRIILSMEEPESAEVVAFWRNVCVVNSGSGFETYNGWISAFCFWNQDGRAQLSSQSVLKQDASRARMLLYHKEVLCLDNIYYGKIRYRQVSAGYVKIPEDIDDNGLEVKAEMLSGSVGISRTVSGRVSAGENGRAGVDTMQPYSAWFIYEIPSKKTKEKNKP